MYKEEELLMLSGIQHLSFCERQFSLTHIEEQWKDNVLTVEGSHLHEHVDDPFYISINKGVITMRSVHLCSYRLGLYGIADVIELHKTFDIGNSMTHPRFPGNWLPVPVEYKHGQPKIFDEDRLQLCAQAIALEEMYELQLKYGFIYYGKVRHREKVEFTPELREKVDTYSKRMHYLFANGITPLIEVKKQKCRLCSLFDLCMPNNLHKDMYVKNYLNILKDEETT